MATKRKFFRRTKPPIGEKSEKPRGKQVRKKIQKNVVQEGSKPSFSFKSKLKMPQFPNIYRSITERLVLYAQKLQDLRKPFFPTKVSHWLIGGAVGIVGIVLVGEIVVVAWSGLKLASVLQQRGFVYNQLLLWKDIAQKYPSYRDADFKVARLAYQLGDRETTTTYLGKTLAIDPNYAPALKLQQINK